MKSETKIKIAVLVSGGGTNLQALIDAQKAGVAGIVIRNNSIVGYCSEHFFFEAIKVL